MVRRPRLIWLAAAVAVILEVGVGALWNFTASTFNLTSQRWILVTASVVLTLVAGAVGYVQAARREPLRERAQGPEAIEVENITPNAELPDSSRSNASTAGNVPRQFGIIPNAAECLQPRK